MDPRVKAAVLWGAIGALSFLVLLQGYRLYSGFDVPVLVYVAGAFGVGVVSGGLSSLVDQRLGNESH
ncbi:hypothetical protein [Natronomonas sp. EA1]|uniref:hypothetical protein n=1 Tax=Natronomonas sp. EA1 TaxID=3421655 RepID=UPI003EB6CE26